MTASNILSGFAATGIWPFNPTKILSKLQTKTPTPPSSDEELKRKTPNSVRGVCRAIKALKEEDPALSFGVELIVRGMEKLVVGRDILQHQVDQLRGTIVNEKKRRKRGKNMGLFTKDEPGQAMFFSPGKIAAAKARQEELDTQKEEERLAKEAEKQRKAFKKEQKAQEARDRKIARQEAAAQKREAKEREKEARMLQRQANQQLEYDQSIPKTVPPAPAKSKKRKAVEDPPLEPPSPKSRVGRSGRTIALPARFH